MAHVEGQSRYQTTLFAEVLDEVVGRHDPVRVIDAFVDTLDLADLGFSKVAAEEMGRPPYAPGDLLKLYVYGYLNRVRSSRRLEAETHRNVEVMALLAPPREGEFAWHAISTRVNHVANDDAQLILPITAEQREAEEPVSAKRPAPRKPAPAASDDGQGSLF